MSETNKSIEKYIKTIVKQHASAHMSPNSMQGLISVSKTYINQPTFEPTEILIQALIRKINELEDRISKMEKANV